MFERPYYLNQLVNCKDNDLVKILIGVRIVRDYEIDFVAIKNNEPIYIHVSESINNLETRTREVKPFINLTDKYPRYLVTNINYSMIFYD